MTLCKPTVIPFWFFFCSWNVHSREIWLLWFKIHKCPTLAREFSTFLLSLEGRNFLLFVGQVNWNKTTSFSQKIAFLTKWRFLPISLKKTKWTRTKLLPLSLVPLEEGKDTYLSRLGTCSFRRRLTAAPSCSVPGCSQVGRESLRCYSCVQGPRVLSEATVLTYSHKKLAKCLLSRCTSSSL